MSEVTGYGGLAHRWRVWGGRVGWLAVEAVRGPLAM